MYGLLYHSATFEGQMQRTNGHDRPFILTRAGFVGTQRTAAIWTGDNKADWGHLAISTPMLLSLSVAGNVFVGMAPSSMVTVYRVQVPMSEASSATRTSSC